MRRSGLGPHGQDPISAGRCGELSPETRGSAAANRNAVSQRGSRASVGCAAVWLPADSSRWRAYRSDDPFDQDDPPAVAFYCRDCAKREFDDGVRDAECGA